MPCLWLKLRKFLVNMLLFYLFYWPHMLNVKASGIKLYFFFIFTLHVYRHFYMIFYHIRRCQHRQKKMLLWPLFPQSWTSEKVTRPCDSFTLHWLLFAMTSIWKGKASHSNVCVAFIKTFCKYFINRDVYFSLCFFC